MKPWTKRTGNHSMKPWTKRTGNHSMKPWTIHNISRLLGVIVLLIVGVSVYIWLANEYKAQNSNSIAASNVTSTEKQVEVANPVKPGLPNEDQFSKFADNQNFTLWVEPTTAHFKVESKDTGSIWRSYPDPAHWDQETITGSWKNNLLSPVMIEYIDASNSKSQTKFVNWMEDQGVLEGFEAIPEGFRVTFRFTGKQFSIPIEVHLKDDYVQTTIIDSGIKEGALSLLNLKLYPLFGAQPSIDQDGYVLIPDGSGALIRFDHNRSNDKSIYRENIYGADASFYNDITSRNEIRMPIFGLKSGDQSFLAVITEGEEYAKLFAAPAGALGQSNWVTPEWQYRIKFFQSTNKKGTEGFYTFSKTAFSTNERATRYYPLEGEASSYVGMAGKYREYLMKEKSMARLAPVSEHIPMFVDVIGADLQEGILWDDYIPGTTTSQAIDMIDRLHEDGIERMIIHYTGWQKWGYSSYGGLFPVDARIGGNEGMKSFIEHAHSLQFPVFLSANYSLNNNGRGGFWARRDGLRNLAGTLLEEYNFVDDESITLTSPLFAAESVQSDLEDYEQLGADGILFTGGMGSVLNTDFNNRFLANREAVLDSQVDTFAQTKQYLGAVAVEDGNFYSILEANHIHRLVADYSYDIFVDEAIPFAQIVLHGLIPYSADYGNSEDERRNGFLESIEFGSYPSYVFTAADSEDFKQAYTIKYYSMNYREWEQTAATEYRRFDEALGDVQDQFIINHRTLSPNVKETVYEDGTRIVVNYSEKSYSYKHIQVPGKDFIIIPGGDEQ